MEHYPNLKKLMEKYNKSINTNVKEMRLTTIEVGLILTEITELSMTVATKADETRLLKDAVEMLTAVLKQSMETDDGF